MVFFGTRLFLVVKNLLKLRHLAPMKSNIDSIRTPIHKTQQFLYRSIDCAMERTEDQIDIEKLFVSPALWRAAESLGCLVKTEYFQMRYVTLKRSILKQATTSPSLALTVFKNCSITKLYRLSIWSPGGNRNQPHGAEWCHCHCFVGSALESSC